MENKEELINVKRIKMPEGYTVRLNFDPPFRYGNKAYELIVVDNMPVIPRTGESFFASVFADDEEGVHEVYRAADTKYGERLLPFTVRDVFYNVEPGKRLVVEVFLIDHEGYERERKNSNQRWQY